MHRTPARFEARAARVAVGNTAALVAVGATATLLTAGTAAADDNPPETQHNVTYRARVDGLARSPHHLPDQRRPGQQRRSGDAARSDLRGYGGAVGSQEAGMRISIQWPYSANLHCEILVDDELTVQADQFISPRVTRRDDPDYGAMNCRAPCSAMPPEPRSTQRIRRPFAHPATTPMPNPADTDDVPLQIPLRSGGARRPVGRTSPCRGSRVGIA